MFQNKTKSPSPIKIGEQSGKQDLVKRVEFVKCAIHEINSIVLAKQKYSIPWPARVLNIEKRKVFVHFFGEKRDGFVDQAKIYDFVKSANAVKSIFLSKSRTRGYITGAR